MFIGEDYISIGQFTSYLKKFNVNPQNLEHEIFNHQYMANLSAPYSESYSTYATLRDNNQLNNSYNFNIPIFTNMPNSTFNSSIRNITLSTAGVQDTQFENMISNFPDSYKQYLRYLHTIHQNWVFTPMITNIDFNTAVSREKNVSSINISSGLCDSPTVITESGWCIATSDAVSFYLDPRNFLNEKYIFMFEDLSYNEVYSETLVKGVLNGTFMSDMDLIDNQTYSSIFVEAGKTTNVSPVYLASLSRQETGTTISNTTNGAEFTYEGYTYSGLYNFFNIGAYSSATNPALAGLVFANGGAGINQGGTITPQTPVVIDNNYIEMLKLGKIGSYLKGYSIGTTFNTIKNIVGSRATVVIKNPNGTTISGDSPIGTGYQILMSNTSGSGSYIYVLYGDISGEGEINSADLLKLRQHLLGTNVLNGAYLEAANVTKDSEVNSADILKIRQYLLGSSNIEQ
jgi:beta-N-acetylglucosaminidase